MPHRFSVPLHLGQMDAFPRTATLLKPFARQVRTFSMPLVCAGSSCLGVQPTVKREAVLRKSWKEFGLGFLNLLLLILVVGLIQPLVKKYIPSAGPLVLAALILPTYWLGSQWIEHRNPDELASSRALPEMLGGLALGTALFSVVMAILWACGVYQPSGWGGSSHLASAAVFVVLAGILEEVVFRGFLFRLFSKIVGTLGALLLTAALFGAAHAGNRNATLGSSIAIAIEAGLLLGAAYAVTNRLWLPIGLHIGWNFCEGSIFGMALSGNTMEPGMLRGSLQGPALLTGGAFGPEASLVAVLLCLAVAAFLLWRVVKLQRIESPVWNRAKQAQQILAQTTD